MSNAVKILKHFEVPPEEGVHHRLICLTGKNKGVAYFIVNKRVVLGRSEKADIRVHDIKSSREHAEIIKVGKDYVVTDLASQNGVIVNDLKIKQHILSNGDKIIIGKTVYKFNRVEVKPDPNKLKRIDQSEEDEDDEVDEPKSNKMSLILILLIIGGIFILFTEGGNSPEVIKKKKSNLKINEISDPFVNTLTQQKSSDEAQVKKKLEIYFKKGLREYREGNYFRALTEFENARSWKLNDPLAQFYIRKTKEALDRSIEESFIKAKRDEDSLKFQAAVTSYCSIVRLLFSKKEDERYKNALQGVRDMEAKLGLAEGEIECLQEIKE